MQIKLKLTIQFIGIVSLILMLSFIIIHLNTIRYRHNEFKDLLKHKGITASGNYFRLHERSPDLLKFIDLNLKNRIQNENEFIFTQKNELIYQCRTPNGLNISQEYLNFLRLHPNEMFKIGETELLAFEVLHKGARYLVISTGIDHYGNTKVRNRGSVLIILFCIIVLVVAIAGWFFSKRALEPITSVIEKAEQISPDNLSARLEKSRNNDEIGRLINTFNNLLGRIEEAFKLQKLFVASASHQIKNPLTAITAQLEVSLLSERSTETYRNTLKSVLEDIRELNELTVQLMELARISNHQDIAFERFRIDETLWEIREIFHTKYPGYRYDYQIIELPEDENQLYIKGNETLIKNAFLNLAENACKYSEDKSVKVSLEYRQNQIMVRFSDKGTGMTEQEIALIFEPFYRGIQHIGIKGHGIGLPLVYQIMKLHNAPISVHSIPGTGTVFTLTFAVNSN